MANTILLTVEIGSGEALDVRDFTVHEALSRPFEVQLTAMSQNPDVDFEAAIGKPATFRIATSDGQARFWSGILARAGLGRVEEDGLSSYHLRIVPTLWQLGQRRNYRVFQDKSELDVVLLVLEGWGIEPKVALDSGSYPKRRMRTQYAETDLGFVHRLLEDIGVTYCFEQDGSETKLVLVDAPNKRSPRAPVPFTDSPNERVGGVWVSDAQTHRELRPGKYTQSDVDYRKALNYPLAASQQLGSDVEAQMERYHHNYGSFLWKADQGGGDTPTADDRGPARTSQGDGSTQVQKRLLAQREGARQVRFRTSQHDLAPGVVFSISGHPRAELGAPLLVVASRFNGTALGNWVHLCEARYTDIDYRPPLRTPKPRTFGIESATVTGPAGEEIHTDEFGRVRVYFHWDREGKADETSSCWVPVSQPWAGAGFGAINLPRVGQEVIVDFLGGDPDRPIVVGRVYTLTTPPPYQLPKYKMVSGHRSNSYPQSQSAQPQETIDGAPQALSAGGNGGSGNGGSGNGASNGSGTGPNARPGLTAVGQAPASQRADIVNTMNSKGPDLLDHYRAGNCFASDDSCGSEKFYLQAQKDFNLTVKNDLMGSITANRGYTVYGNDTETVGGIQEVKVGGIRLVAVQGDQTHGIGGNMVVDCEKNIVTATPHGSQQLFAKESIALTVGESTILMQSDAIVINAPNVYINPGSKVMDAIAAGTSAHDAATAQQNAEAAAEKAAADKAAAEKAQPFIDAMGTGRGLAGF